MADIKTEIVKRAIDITGNIIADQLSKPDWEARKENISQYYKDLQPIRETLPEAPAVRETPVVREIPEQREETGNVDKIVDEICTPDLSPKELSECRESVESVIKDPSMMNKYLKSSATS